MSILDLDNQASVVAGQVVNTKEDLSSVQLKVEGRPISYVTFESIQVCLSRKSVILHPTTSFLVLTITCFFLPSGIRILDID